MSRIPEQIARDNIDNMLSKAGWVVQEKDKLDMSTGLSIAVREYQTDVGPADYVLFSDGVPMGIVETRRYKVKW